MSADLPSIFQRAFDEITRGFVRHPLDQVADHFGAECRCMVVLPDDPAILTYVSARMPMHPDEAARVLRLSGAWCDHPQLPGWKLVEVTLLPAPLALPWPPTLPDRYLCDYLRAECGRRLGHDPRLVSISLPHRDCPRHGPAPVEPAASDA
jgi:hypothetical protein